MVSSRILMSKLNWFCFTNFYNQVAMPVAGQKTTDNTDLVRAKQILDEVAWLLTFNKNIISLIFLFQIVNSRFHNIFCSKAMIVLVLINYNYKLWYANCLLCIMMFFLIVFSGPLRARWRERQNSGVYGRPEFEEKEFR